MEEQTYATHTHTHTQTAIQMCKTQICIIHQTCTHARPHPHAHTHTHNDCSRNWLLILVWTEIVWEEEGFQFGFKRWHGWAASKASWVCVVQQSGRVAGVGAGQHVQSPAGLPVPALRPRPCPTHCLGAAAVPEVGLSPLQVRYFVHSSADVRSVSSPGAVLCAQQCWC